MKKEVMLLCIKDVPMEFFNCLGFKKDKVYTAHYDDTIKQYYTKSEISAQHGLPENLDDPFIKENFLIMDIPTQDWNTGNKRSNYKEVKNYIHNDLNITKEYINDIIKEAVKEEVEKLISSNHIDNLVEKRVSYIIKETYGSRGLGTNIYSNIRGEIAKEIGKTVAKNINIDVSWDENEAKGVNFIRNIDLN